MKKIITIACLLAFAAIMQAQQFDYWADGPDTSLTTVAYNTGSVATTSRVTVAREPDAKFIEYWKDGPDTTASTRINEAGGSSIDGPLYYDMGLYLDVIGDTATINVDFLPYGGATWIPFDTITAAKADTYYLYQGSTVGGKFRAGVTSTGAGSSALTMWTMYAKKED